MSPTESLLAFTATAAILTVTPGLTGGVFLAFGIKLALDDR